MRKFATKQRKSIFGMQIHISIFQLLQQGSGEEREGWLLLPEPLGHNRVCHIEPRDKVPTVKSTIKVCA